MRVKVYVVELPSWVRRFAVPVGVGVAGLLAWMAVSAAAVPNTFKDGDVLTAQALNDNFKAASGVPAGTVVAYAGDPAKIPEGWLLCDGAPLDRSAFAPLFAAIGTTWGAPNGQQFNLPDLRGRFLRGTNGTSSVDPDCAGRTPSATGGATGCAVGTTQGDAIPAHTHTLTIPASVLINGYSMGSGQSFYAAGTSPGTVMGTTSSVGAGPEARPKNAAVVYIVKS
jgi:microcystin-dependent protein